MVRQKDKRVFRRWKCMMPCRCEGVDFSSNTVHTPSHERRERSYAIGGHHVEMPFTWYELPNE
jgi:hypothetical protein